MRSAFFFFLVTAMAQTRNIVFVNQCPTAIWVAAQGNPLPAGGGWKMEINSTKSLIVPSTLSAARFWPRTDCITSGHTLRCQTGDCPLPQSYYNSSNSGVMCSGIGGLPPASLVEMTLGGYQGDDFYDISLVDGYNIGIGIEVVGGISSRSMSASNKYNCGSPSCTQFDFNRCPPELRLKRADGVIVGCLSICAAVNDERQRSEHSVLQAIWNGRDQSTGYSLVNLVCCACGTNATEAGCYDPRSEFCCSPLDRTPRSGGKCHVERWPRATDGQRYDQVFKDQCPDAYSWQFDDFQSTYQCVGPDYKVIFCPFKNRTV